MNNSHSLQMSPQTGSKIRRRSFQSKQTTEKEHCAVETEFSTEKQNSAMKQPTRLRKREWRKKKLCEVSEDSYKADEIVSSKRRMNFTKDDVGLKRFGSVGNNPGCASLDGNLKERKHCRNRKFKN